MAGRYVVLFMALCFRLFGVDATLTIEKDVEQRARIAVVDASSGGAPEVHRLFLSDLRLSGHFLPLKRYATGTFNDGLHAAARSQEYMLKYDYSDVSGAVLRIKLVRVSDRKEILNKRYAVSRASKMPFLVHKAVYDVNALLRYPDIAWINRYVLYARYVAPRMSEIGVADYTFTYRKPVIKGGLNLFPKWADTKQSAFYYTSMSRGIPTLYRLNIYTGKRTLIARSEGMLVCSDVSKDGKRLLLTMAPEGQPDIYEMRLATSEKRRLTRFNGIDVGARYAEGDKSVVFVSNRLGYANIFKKRIDRGAVAQLVYHGRNNNACDASQERVVYVSRESNSPFSDNKFNLYMTDIYGGQTRPLTTTGSNQFPRFASEGTMLLYLKQNRRGTHIGYINLESRQSALFPLGWKLQSIDW